MKLLPVILLTAAIFYSRVPANGQGNLYRYETRGTRDGLSSSKIFSLLQANDRRLWVGAELGVSVFNGYEFKNFLYSSSHEMIGRVLCITEDSLRGIWIGGDRGLFYYTGTDFRHIVPGTGQQLAVEALHTDENGNVWIGDIRALYRLTENELVRISKDPSYKPDLVPHASFNKRVFCLSSDSDRNLYIGTHEGVYRINNGSDSYTQIWKNENPRQPVISVAALHADSLFWNCLNGHPVQMIKGRISTYFTKEYLGRSVFKWKKKIVALTTSGVGLLENGNVKHLFSFVRITNNAVAAIVDAEDHIWIGTWEGLLKYYKTPFRQYRLSHPVQKEVFSLLEKSNGDLLFGSNRGLVFTRKGDSIVPETAINPLFPLAEVLTMYEAADGSLWAGSGYQGISRFEKNQLTNWSNTALFPDNNCEALIPTNKGQLVACTENGVSIIDPVAGQPFLAHYPFKKSYGRMPELFGCYRQNGGGWWFYGSQGLYKLENNRLTDDSIALLPVKNLYINRIVSDRKGQVWIATLGRGLLRCRVVNNRLVLLQQYDQSSGLRSDNALSVIVDKNDDVWCGDYMSIVRLRKPGTSGEQITWFGERDGLPETYYQSLKLEQQRDGTIWGLTSMGLVSFHPDRLEPANLPPVLRVDKIITAGETTENPFVTVSISGGSFQIFYSAVTFSDPGRVSYAYRIPELDSHWVVTRSRMVDLNLPKPGVYTFELKGAANNVWTPEPLRTQILIRASFWQTPWFRMLLVLLIAMLIYWLFRKRLRAIKQQAGIRQQLAELEAKAIRAQMNPHFIFNSLNAIQESILSENVDVAYAYLSRFSKLLRMVLDHSEKSMVPLSKEIETVRLYLSLEALRFSHSFSYTITITDELEKEDIFIPSMLVQPFAENAIWHGLINKEGDKKLMISFEEHSGILECIIQDNGVGRKKAAEIKLQKLGGERFASKGTGLALQRIGLLNRERPGSAAIETIDLYDEAGQPEGTRVVIRLSAIKSLNITRYD